MKSIECIEVRAVFQLDNPEHACKGNQVRESILVRFQYGEVRYQGRVVTIRNHIPWSPTWQERSNNAEPPPHFRNYLDVEKGGLSVVFDRFFTRHDGTGFLFRHFQTSLRKLLDARRLAKSIA